MVMVTSLIFLILGYVVGAIPTGYFFCKFFFNIDITASGSGNIGASNVARVLGKKYFIIIFLLDALKAYAALAFGNAMTHGYGIASWSLHVVTAGLLLGNAYSFLLNFKGGKGVATTCGIISYVLPWFMVVCFIATWLIVVAITKAPFWASLASMLTLLLSVALCASFEQVVFVGIIFMWLLFRHSTNLVAWLQTKAL